MEEDNVGVVCELGGQRIQRVTGKGSMGGWELCSGMGNKLGDWLEG